MSSTIFSIVIPTYNSSASIGRCLDSILVQNLGQYEIIIVDGLSSDNTVDIISSYTKNHSNINLISESDLGVYDAMNKGISRAKGEWLYFLGSDDVLNDPQVLNDVKKAIETQSADFIYGNVILTKNGSVYDGFFTIEKLCTQCNICHQAIFYKKALFDRIGYYNLNYNIWADWDLNIRCFSNPFIKTLYLDRIICMYNNQSGHSVMADKKFEKLVAASYIDKIAALETTVEYLQSYLKNIHKSKPHRIGNSILMPYRFIRRLLKRK